MITLIEALNYRCLKYISQSLHPVQVLVGPNASGKTTFLDVPLFIADVINDGILVAVEKRTSSFSELTWMAEGNQFELAVEAKIPEARRKDKAFNIIRYEIKIGLDEANDLKIYAEKALLKKDVNSSNPTQRDLFPSLQETPQTIMSKRFTRNTDGRLVLNKTPGGNDNYYSETYHQSGKGWVPSVKLGPKKSALGNLPDDENSFPALTWFREHISSGVQSIMLNSLTLRKASPPRRPNSFSTDGSNLPWIVNNLCKHQPSKHREWVKHIRSALPDVMDIKAIERPDDKHCYLVLKYDNGLSIPSWMASDGTLRLLGLTIPAYLSNFTGVYLIEEPENGIHPKAMEIVFQSLSSIYNAQILLATHSPVILSMVEPEKVLCFAKTPEGYTDIIAGNLHPKLKDWKGNPDFSTLFASGVLG